MPKFDFTSPASHAFTNINHRCFLSICDLSSETTDYNAMKFREDIIKLGDLRPSDVAYIQIDPYYEFTESKLNKLKAPKFLIVQLYPGAETEVDEFVYKVSEPRRKLLKSTILLTDRPDIRYKQTLSDIKAVLLSDAYTPVIKNREFKNFLFLDIDGVLLTYRESLRTRWACTHSTAFLDDPVKSSRAFDQLGLNFLSKFCSRHEIGIVLCSQWRIGLSELEVISLGRYLGLPIFDSTRSFGERAEEINEWVTRTGVTGQLIVIDDEKYEIEKGIHIHIDPKNGITWEKMTEMTGIFNDDILEYTNSMFNYFK